MLSLTGVLTLSLPMRGGVAPVPPPAPTNSIPPAISGQPYQDRTLRVSRGTWSGDPTSYAYQWRRDGAAISGATGNSYVTTSDDLGATITCTVTATNAVGPTASTSGGIGPITVYVSSYIVFNANRFSFGAGNYLRF